MEKENNNPYESPKHLNNNSIPKNNIISFFKGYSFTFKHNGRTIIAWFSAFTGLEKVFVDNKLIATQRTFSRNSSINFSIDETKFAINLNAESLLKGPFVCTLHKEGKPYMRQKLVFYKNRVATITIFIAILALSILYIFLKNYWQLPEESKYIFLALIFSIAVYSGFSQAAIEDEEIIP